ncbi:hypothetical protein WEI85_00650 [Actinomycetes bacterium KLBMP 9797]
MSWWNEQDDQRRAKISAALDTERGQQYLRTADGDQGFAAWLLVADVTCLRRFGMSIFDIADWAWRDAYDDDQPPATALRDALEADDMGALLLGGEQ